VYRISPDDIVFNPLATSFKKSPKIIRSLKTLGELHRDLEENPELGYSEEIVDTITKNREVLKRFTDTAVDKHIQMQYDGFGSPSMYYKSGYVEILEFYGDIYDEDQGKFLKNRVITIVDRQYVIRNEPLKTWTGYPNIFHVAWRVRPDNLWGMGPLDNLVGMQYLINHLENSRADGFDQMLDPDRVFKGDVEVERRGAALDYYVTDVSIGGDVGHLAPDTTILNADFQIERKEQQMEEYAGAPREAMGIRTPGEKTKFEVQTLTNSASRMFQHKINYFEEQFVEPILNAEIEVARQHIDGTDLVRVLDTDLGVAEFLQITKADLTSNGKIVPIGARHFARQASMAQELMQLQGVLQQDPMMAQHFPASNLAKVWEDILGFKRLDLYEQFGRVNEELEYNRLKSAADEQIEVEQQIPIDEGLE
jgi:hypothetical protein